MAVKPMTGQAFFVLTALADSPRHGYGIVREVADLSQGRVKLKIGSLYGVLDRLAGRGAVRGRRRADRGRPGGSARRPAAPLLPAYPGRAGRAGRGGRPARGHRPGGADETGPSRRGGG